MLYNTNVMFITNFNTEYEFCVECVGEDIVYYLSQIFGVDALVMYFYRMSLSETNNASPVTLIVRDIELIFDYLVR